MPRDNIYQLPPSRGAPDGSRPLSRPAIDLERAARATRDAGMQSYFATRGARHVVVEDSWLDDLRADAREVLSEIREHPLSHFLVGMATLLGTMLLLIAPLMVTK